MHLGSLPLMEQRFTVGAGGTREFRIIAPQDVDQVMDLFIAHGMEDSDPYWTRAWPSAIALAAAVLERPHLVAGKRVADLGAGLGLAGLAALLAGAREVVLLDRERLALQCGLLSAAATCGSAADVQGLAICESPAQPSEHPSQFCFHGPELKPYVDACPAGAEGKGSTAVPAGPPRPVIQGRVFDWHAGPASALGEGGSRFDVVLACDVLYEESAVEPIAALVPGILKHSDGLLMLADPPNRTAANRQRFVELVVAAAARGGGVGRARLALQENIVVDSCRAHLLDPEMCGGLGAAECGGRPPEVVPVQLMLFRSALGSQTVGVKAL